jgi:hypothetical protein
LPGSSDPTLGVSCIRRCSRARRTIAHPLRLRPTLPPDHVNDRTWLACVKSETLALIHSSSPAWRAADSRFFEGGSGCDRVSFRLSAPWHGGLRPLPIVSPSALLARVSPSSVDRTPRNESRGNAGGSTDASRHSNVSRERWKTSRERALESRNLARPPPRRDGRNVAPKRLLPSISALA